MFCTSKGPKNSSMLMASLMESCTEGVLAIRYDPPPGEPPRMVSQNRRSAHGQGTQRRMEEGTGCMAGLQATNTPNTPQSMHNTPDTLYTSNAPPHSNPAQRRTLGVQLISARGVGQGGSRGCGRQHLGATREHVQGVGIHHKQP